MNQAEQLWWGLSTRLAWHGWQHPGERVLTWLVWRLPRGLVMWCAIRLIAHATTGRYGSTDPSTLDVMEALQRWGADNRD